MSEFSRSSVTFQLSVLVIGGVGLWALLAGPAWLLAGTIGLIGLTISAVLCLSPALVAVGFDKLFTPSQSVLFLVSTGLRFGLILASALVAKVSRPEFGLLEFYVWLIVFYLFTLAVETWLLLRKAG